MLKQSLERILKHSWRKVDIVKRYFQTIPLSGHLHVLKDLRNGFGSNDFMSEILLPKGISLPRGLALKTNPV